MMSKKYLVVFLVLSIVLALGVISTVPAKENQGLGKYDICKESKRTERTLIITASSVMNPTAPRVINPLDGNYTIAFPQDAWDPTKNVTVNKAYLDIVRDVSWDIPLYITVNGNDDSTLCSTYTCRAEIQPSHLNPGANELDVWYFFDVKGIYFTVEYTYTPTQC